MSEGPPTTEADIRKELEQTRLALLHASERIRTGEKDYAGLLRKAASLQNALRHFEIHQSCSTTETGYERGASIHELGPIVHPQKLPGFTGF